MHILHIGSEGEGGREGEGGGGRGGGEGRDREGGRGRDELRDPAERLVFVNFGCLC